MNNLTQRMDVLDLIIEVLAGHEKELDELIGRLERGLTQLKDCPYRQQRQNR